MKNLTITKKTIETKTLTISLTDLKQILSAHFRSQVGARDGSHLNFDWEFLYSNDIDEEVLAVRISETTEQEITE